MIDTTKQFLNSKLKLVRFSAQVLVMGTILSLTFLLLAIDSLKSYRSDIMILVTAKSELAQAQSKKISNSIIEIPRTLSFYDRLLKYNPDVRDVAEGLSPDERKKNWNKMFSIEQMPEDSSIFKLSMTTRREADAQQLSIKSARTLFDTLAFYYDIKNDADLRIIDGPISQAQVPHFFWLLVVSLIGGFSLSALLNSFLISGKNLLTSNSDLPKKSFFNFKKETELPVENEIESLRKLYQNEQSDSPFLFEEKIEEVPEIDQAFQEMKKITKQIEPSKYPNFSEMPVREKQPESVPDNLPIADETFFAEYENPQQAAMQESTSVVPTIEEDIVADTKKEPTPEELKERLNKLLRGEL